MWIPRDISAAILGNHDPIQVLRGPRQCGKSSLLLHLGRDFTEVSLDDPSLRELARSDPELFLKQFEDQKFFIDEAQYAPELFPSLKRRADLYKRTHQKTQTIIRLTGSNQILMDRHVKESLAGRASFFDLNTLSVSEILTSSTVSIQNILYQGGWPELYANPDKSVKKYLDDYVSSYIERDIVLSAGIQKSREFLRFIQLLAGRVAQILDVSNLSREVGVDAKTVKEWVSVLERMHVVALVAPYATNLSSRLVKSPKVYFIDSGLACRLQGWTASTPIMTSPLQGALFENLVYSELHKMNQNFQMGWQIYHWRSRDGEEIDFLLVKNPTDHMFIEAKVSSQRSRSPEDLPEVRKVFGQHPPPQIVVHQEGTRILGDQVPIAQLQTYLLAPRACQLG